MEHYYQIGTLNLKLDRSTIHLHQLLIKMLFLYTIDNFNQDLAILNLKISTLLLFSSCMDAVGPHPICWFLFLRYKEI